MLLDVVAREDLGSDEGLGGGFSGYRGTAKNDNLDKNMYHSSWNHYGVSQIPELVVIP